MSLETLFEELLVIDTTAAKKYFSLKDYVGKTITIEITELLREFKGLYKHGYVQEDSSPEAKDCVSMRVIVDGNEMLWVSYKHRLAKLCQSAGIKLNEKNPVKVVKDGKSYNFLKAVPPKSERSSLNDEVIELCMHYGDDELGQQVKDADEDTWDEIIPKVVNAQILRFGIALLDWKSPAVIRILQTYAVEFIKSNRDVELIKVAREKANASLMELIKSAA